MARLTDALLNGKAFSENRNQPMLDVSMGGQHGFAPNLSQWISNQSYVRRNLVCLLIEAPKFFDIMPNNTKWVQTLRSLVELHAKSIDGLHAGLTVDVSDTPVGGGGEVQEEVTNVTRARSQPTFVFQEKYGMPIQSFLRDWITYGLMDPDTKFANVGTLDPTKVPKDMLADWYSCTCLFFEPDPTHRKVVKAWLVTNMFPKGTGDIDGKRDLTAAGEMLELSIEFTGIAQYNLGTVAFAQKLLDNINITNANPYLQKAFLDPGPSFDPALVNNLSPTVTSDTTTGYSTNVLNTANANLKL
jgi:hypothetical protein